MHYNPTVYCCTATASIVRVFSDVLVAFLYFDICHWQISKYGKATLTSEKARITASSAAVYWCCTATVLLLVTSHTPVINTTCIMYIHFITTAVINGDHSHD